MADGERMDGMSIGILRDADAVAHVDYFYFADLWAPDPRFKSRQMVVGQCRGLFRVDKQTLNVELLYAASGDHSGQCFNKAASKVLREFRVASVWPERTQYAAG